MLRFPGRIFLGGPWAEVFDAISDLLGQMDRVENKVGQMATRADIDAVKAELSQAISDATNRVVATITDLQGQLASGTPITDQDLIDLKADVAGVAAVDPSPAPTPPAP